MDYERFLRGIRFKDIDPMMKEISIGFKLDKQYALRRARYQLDTIDASFTVLPEGQEEYRKLLEPILQIPRYSTYANAAIIARTVREMAPDASYVNVGTWHGFSLLAGMLAGPDRKVVGVDNFSEFGGPRKQAMARFQRFKGEQHSFFDMDYREYFSKAHKGEIGFYFYDGEHSYDNQLKGLMVAEPFFAKDCIVMVDDTNWDAPRRATLDFMSESRHSYRIVMDRSTAWDGHPTFWNGLLLLKRVS